MTDTIDVANSGSSSLTLPCGTTVPAGATVPVSVASLQADRSHPVVAYWLAEHILVPAEPIPDAEPAADTSAPSGKGAKAAAAKPDAPQA